MELQVGDILLKKGSTIGSKIIRYLTADDTNIKHSYSHCGIYAGGNKVYDSRFPKIDMFELDYQEFDVYRVPLTKEQIEKLMTYCASRIGDRYATEELIQEGIEKLFHIPIGVDFEGNEEWCSTFVCEAFALIGAPLTHKPLPTPNDISWSVVGNMVSYTK